MPPFLEPIEVEAKIKKYCKPIHKLFQSCCLWHKLLLILVPQLTPVTKIRNNKKGSLHPTYCKMNRILTKGFLENHKPG